MITKISPFLRKKFFEYADDYATKGKNVVRYECLNTPPSSINHIGSIIKDKGECFFFVPQSTSPLKRNVFIGSLDDVDFLIEDLAINKSIVIFYYHDGGLTVSVDSASEFKNIDLTISAWGVLSKQIERLQAAIGGIFYT